MERTEVDQNEDFLQPSSQTQADDSPKKCEVHLLDEHESLSCNFWILFYKRGTLKSSQLIKRDSLSQLFQEIESSGVNDHDPVLMVNSSTPEIKKTYIYPTFDSSSETGSQWTGQFITRLNRFHLESVGIYLPKSMNLTDLTYLITQIIQKEVAQKIYLLNTQSRNRLLNTVVKIRMSLQKQNKPITIFH